MNCWYSLKGIAGNIEFEAIPLKTHSPVCSTSFTKGLGTRKPIEWQRLNSHVEVQIRDNFSTGKYYFPTMAGILP